MINENDKRTLFELLQDTANEQIMTFSELTKKAGMSPNTMYQLRKRQPSIRTYRKLAEATGIDALTLRQYPIKRDNKEEDKK